MTGEDWFFVTMGACALLFLTVAAPEVADKVNQSPCTTETLTPRHTLKPDGITVYTYCLDGKQYQIATGPKGRSITQPARMK